MRRDSERRVGRWAVTLAVVAAGAWPEPAWARQASPAWSVEIYGFGSAGQQPKSGTAIAEFPVGDTFLMETTPRFPTRAVSSWLFGDGARLFNQVVSQFSAVSGTPFASITPLDAVLTSAAARRAPGAGFGGRVGRRLTRRLGVELSLDWSRTPVEITDGARAAIEDTLASYESAFRGVFETAPVTNLIVSARPEYRDASTQEMSVAGAVTIAFGRLGAFKPYLAAGGGVVRTTGELPEAVLRSSYQFRLFGTSPLNETDNVTIRITDRGTAPAGVIGGGVNLDLGPRHALRVDVRARISGNRLGIVASAAPSTAPGTPSTVLPSNTNPGFQFSTTNGTRSSLSGGPLELRTFSGSGLETRVLVSAGYVVRF